MRNILEPAGCNNCYRTPDDKLRWAFKMYDEDNSREVDYQEMENVILLRFRPKHTDLQDFVFINFWAKKKVG